MKFISFVKSSALKRVGAVSLTLALGAGLVGCGGNGAGGAVAATVNGQNIMEQTVTDYVAQFRADSGLESDEAWGEWMVANNYTPETVREEVIEYYVKQDLYDQAAAEYNVAVEQADIDEAMEQTKAMFESEEAFKEALEASGMTEETYIETNLRPRLMESKLAEAVANAENGGGDEALLAQAQSASDQFNGAKRTSHILLTAEGDETDEALQARAQALIDQINAGTISFEDAVSQNSQDSGSAAKGGDVGWNVLNNFVTEYTDAVAGLNKGDMTASPVKSEFGYHIILRLPLTDETKTQYRDSFQVDAMEDLADQWIAEAQITRAGALDSLNAIDFYRRLSAYHQALAEKDAPAQSGPVESGGVG